MFSADEYMKESAHTLARVFRPEATVHLGIDLQKGYCEPAADVAVQPERQAYYDQARKAVQGVASLSSKFREAGVQNVWVKHVTAALKEQALCVPVDARDGALEKGSFDSFKNTTLAEELAARKIDTVILTGGKNDTCIAATAFSAAKAGLNVFIVQDMTYGKDLSIAKEIADYCEDRASNNIHVVTAEQVQAVLRTHKGMQL